MTDVASAFSTDLEAARVLPVESDYYSNYIPQKFQEFDLELFQTKWFDYRHMTPLQATKAYVEEYGTIYKRIYRREFDRERAEHVKPPVFESVLVGLQKNVEKTRRQFTGFWRGRQVADALGIPYADYIDMAFTFRMRRWKQGYMPQPSHLYHEFDVEKIQLRWDELQASRLYLAEHSAYMNENYQDIPHQNDYHEWLFKQANLRGNPAEHLANFVNDGRLPIDKVRARVPEGTYEMFERYLQ